MASIEQRLFDLGRMDSLARQDTAVHRIDPRAKLLTTLGFIAVVVSFDKHAISGLLPLLAYPLLLAGLGNVPLGYLLRKAAYVLPFVVFIGFVGLFYEPQPAMVLGPVTLSLGCISASSLLLRTLLTVLAALGLVAVTGMGDLCLALEKLGVPRVLAFQLLLLYRYVFVLAREAARMARARSLRSAGGAAMGPRVYGSLIGHLLLRTFDRAERVHLAMLCRGFYGELHSVRELHLRSADVLFVVASAVLFALARAYDLPLLLGVLVTGFMP